MSIVNFALPKKAAPEWRKYWFYIKETTPKGKLAMPMYESARSRPRHLRVDRLPND